MFRALLYLAMAMVASSAIATELSLRSQAVSCSGARVAVDGDVAMKRSLSHETCVATATKP